MIFDRWIACPMWGLLLVVTSGCLHAHQGVTVVEPGPVLAPPVALAVSNPMLVQASNRDALWDTLVDVVDDYFRIEREERVRLLGEVVTEGRIDTFHELGATIFEPWRKDSVGKYNRWEATLQTIRRRAVVRVIPSEQGYLIDVTVDKEIEALAHSVHPTAGDATFRNNNELPFDQEQNRVFGLIPPPVDWAPLGRDVALEQQMLLEIQTRLSGGVAPVVIP